MKEHSLPNDPRKKEMIGIDVMKALFAICVVAIHTHPYRNFSSDPFTLARILDILLLCAVPFFFITTGYFIGQKLQSPFSDENNIAVLKYYLIKNIKLYLIWTAVYLPITLYYYIVISEQSVGMMAVDFLRGLVLYGEHWNSWMLWYLLSMIYALILFILIWHVKGNYTVVYVVSTLIFTLSVILDHYANAADVGLLMRGIRFILGGNARLLTSPFYLSVGVIISRAKNTTTRWKVSVGLILTSVGALIKMSKNNAGGGTLNIV